MEQSDQAALAAFAAAIAPQRLGNAAKGPYFRDRVAVFRARAPFPDHVVRAEVQEVFIARGLSENDAAALIDRIGLPKLRTHVPRCLEVIADNYLEWSPIVCYLEDPSLQRRCGQAIADEFARLLEEVTHRLRKRIRGPTPIDPEDAVHQAISAHPRYSYETPLDHWLRRVAWNFFVGEVRRHLPCLDVVPEAVRVEPPPVVDLGEECSRLATFYRVVRCTFSAKAHCRLDEIWKQLVREGLGEPHVGDDVLAEYIGQEYQVEVKPGNVGLLRCQLRKRLLVLYYIIDLDEDPNSESVLAWQKRRYRLTRRERDILKQLVRWAREYRQNGRWPPEALGQ